MAVDKIRMRLNAVKMNSLPVGVVMRDKKTGEFNAEVVDFFVEELETMVVLKVLESDTNFPTETGEFTTKVKNIKEVNKVESVE
ncbi:MAG: hypothetical protein HRT58_09645 [Crocinitomicaceae bacterium]|nr:hypothetical protein [Flavobacteriales bacterium]NQZ35918.1 hypothetical protein [Crocinitomicaceae bacterium]